MAFAVKSVEAVQKGQGTENKNNEVQLCRQLVDISSKYS
jgi:hypothetical protein